MNTLAPKLVLTPLLVASASAAGRRWGPALSGWLVALPLTSGPIAFFIAIESGSDVAREAAQGSLLGAVAQVAFAAAYTVASRRMGWVASTTFGSIAFVLVAALPPLPAVATYALLVLGVGAFLAVFRTESGPNPSPAAMPGWDIPARAVVATALVVGISALAPMIGGRMSGILATFPVYAIVLATFGHVTRGSRESAEVLRGLATGLLGFGAFFLALGSLLATTGIVESFMVALAVGAAVQAATLPVVRTRSR